MKRILSTPLIAGYCLSSILPASTISWPLLPYRPPPLYCGRIHKLRMRQSDKILGKGKENERPSSKMYSTCVRRMTGDILYLSNNFTPISFKEYSSFHLLARKTQFSAKSLIILDYSSWNTSSSWPKQMARQGNETREMWKQTTWYIDAYCDWSTKTADILFALLKRAICPIRFKASNCDRDRGCTPTISWGNRRAIEWAAVIFGSYLTCTTVQLPGLSGKEGDRGRPTNRGWWLIQTFVARWQKQRVQH